MSGERRLVGIGGGTSCGKTTLINSLVEILGSALTVISFDDYFVGMEPLKGKVIDDWEDPALYHSDRYIRDLQRLKAGETIELDCRSRESKKLGIAHRTIVPTELMIVEGFLVFHWPEARPLFDLKLFIDLPESEMITRRINRREGTTKWDSPEYIHTKLLPGHRRYVAPQKEYADFVLDGRKPTNKLTQEVISLLRSAASQ